MSNQNPIPETPSEGEKTLIQKDFQLISTTLHHVDFFTNNLIDASNKINGNDISEYINDLIDTIITKGDKRSFVFPPNVSYMSLALNSLLKNASIHTDIAENISQRLLLKEIDAQAERKKKNLKHDLRKGSLIQVLLKRYDKFEYLLLKIEHDSYFDLDNLIRQYGLAEKKSVIKSCLIRFNNVYEIDSVILTDTNSSISTYWWKNFLELVKVRKDEDNTKLVFNAVDKLLVKFVKQEDPKAYRVLKGAHIKYFKEKETLNFSDFRNEVFASFVPFNPSLDYNKFLKKLDDLGESKKFDTSFTIVASEIEKEFVSTYRVSNKVSLSVSDGLAKDTIVAYMENDEKFLRVKLEDEITYRQFEK